MTNPDGGAVGGQQRFATELDTMDTAARHVFDVNQEITARLGHIARTVEQFQGVWAGRSHGVFRDTMSQWDAQSRKLNQALNGISETLQGNRAVFADTEADLTASINRVASSGPLNL